MDQKSYCPVLLILDGEFNQNDIFVGVPVVIIGKNGVEKILEVKLTSWKKNSLIIQ